MGVFPVVRLAVCAAFTITLAKPPGRAEIAWGGLAEEYRRGAGISRKRSPVTRPGTEPLDGANQTQFGKSHPTRGLLAWK